MLILHILVKIVIQIQVYTAYKIFHKNKIDLKLIIYFLLQMDNNYQQKSKGLKRNTIDKYYTKSSISELCLTQFKHNITIDSEDLLIEPSAGNGSFIAGIKQITNNFIFFDIYPEHDDISKQDFLVFDHNNIKNKYKKIHAIGNPPFGRQSSTAIKFIKKCSEFCDSISFILPKSFKKETLKKSFPLNYHLIYEIDLPEKSFLLENKEHNVPCIFQIWQKMDTNRIICEKIEPINFTFVDKTQNPDISFRRVGVNAGAIDKNIQEKSIQSHYFIKFTNNKSIDENIQCLSAITYDFNNTVGPKSISKQELITKFNPIMN